MKCDVQSYGWQQGGDEYFYERLWCSCKLRQVENNQAETSAQWFKVTSSQDLCNLNIVTSLIKMGKIDATHSSLGKRMTARSTCRPIFITLFESE